VAGIQEVEPPLADESLTESSAQDSDIHVGWGITGLVSAALLRHQRKRKKRQKRRRRRTDTVFATDALPELWDGSSGG